MEDDDSDPVSEEAGRPLHRETAVNETVQLTVDTADVDEGSMPSVWYMRSTGSLCTVVEVVDAADGDEVVAVEAVDVRRRSDACFRGEQTGQSERTQLFQCQMILRRRAQC